MEPLGHRNKRVVAAAKLHRARERRSSSRTLIEGPHLLEEALAAEVTPEVVFALADDDQTAGLAEDHGFELVLVDHPALNRVAGTESPRGPAAVIEIPSTRPLLGRGLLVAWGLGDPGNVGTLVRTAAAFGWDFGHSPGTADPWAPKVLRAGAGGHFRIVLRAFTSLSEITDTGYTTVATVPSGGSYPSDLAADRYAVLVGEEAAGLPFDVVEEADIGVTIAMPGGSESLNAAVAAGIVVYELSKAGEEGQAQV